MGTLMNKGCGFRLCRLATSPALLLLCVLSANAQNLVPNGRLAPGSFIYSPNMRWQLAYQLDGHFLLYDRNALNAGTPPERSFTWHAKETAGRSAGYVLMRPEGNLVIYDNAGAKVYDTETDGFGSNYLTITDAGNIIMYPYPERPLVAGGGDASVWDATTDNDGGREYCVKLFYSNNGEHAQNIRQKSWKLATNLAEAIRAEMSRKNEKVYSRQLAPGKC